MTREELLDKNKNDILPSDVDEAAKEYLLSIDAYKTTDYGCKFEQFDIETFKAGTEWMAKQGKVFEGEINAYSDDGIKYIESTIGEDDVIIALGLNVGDKVIVQIRKI